MLLVTLSQARTWEDEDCGTVTEWESACTVCLKEMYQHDTKGFRLVFCSEEDFNSFCKAFFHQTYPAYYDNDIGLPRDMRISHVTETQELKPIQFSY